MHRYWDKLYLYPNETEPYAMSIGERIKQARQQKRHSQKELAASMGVTQATISQWENGDYAPERSKMALLAKVLSVTPIWLEFGSPEDNIEWGSDLSPIKEPVRAVPLISWVEAGKFVSSEDPYELGDAERYIAIASETATLIALKVSGTSCNREFPPGTIVIIDYADKTLTEGKFYVFRQGGEATLKRWRNNPARLEPFSTDPSHETIFPEEAVEVVGRVTDAVRHY